MKNNMFGVFQFIIKTPEDLQLVSHSLSRFWSSQYNKSKEIPISIYVTPEHLTTSMHHADAPLITHEELKKLIELYK